MNPQHQYAVACGYTGSKLVIVLDGRVVSHDSQDWFEFIEEVSTP